jgi:hypothetical protein
MSDHIWVLENAEAYVADGLEAAERRRVEKHAASCGDCRRAIDEARAVDDKLDTLFADVRPNPALEDRLIQALRETPIRPRYRLSRRGRIFVAAAAALLLAVVGAGVDEALNAEPGSSRSYFGIVSLGFLDDSRSMGSNNLKQMGLAVHNKEIAGTGEGEDTKEYSRKQTAKVWGRAFRESEGAMDAEEMAQRGRMESLKALESKGKDGVQLFDLVTADKTTLIEVAKDRSVALNKYSVQLPEVQRQTATTYTPQVPLASAYSPDGRQLASAGDNGRKTGGGWNYVDNGVTWFKPGETFSVALAKVGQAKDGEKGDPKAAAMVGDSSIRGFQDGQGQLGGSQNLAGFGVAGAQAQKKDQKKPAEAEPTLPAPGRKIIRSGDIDFEVDSFDAAVFTITKLVGAAKGGFIATINSDKLPNGKVRGSVVVRVPPEHLDSLVAGLRKELGKMGELKGQRIGSQDITKQYIDLESRLKAAKTMEDRLLKIIRDGKGEIKDLLLAEKELGVWRTRIEEVEGELRYYSNLVSLSTLTVTLAEKEIRTAAAVTETERVQAGIEVDDVDQALRETLKAVEEAKGRVTKSELKQHGARQFNAVVHFEVSHDQAGPVRDRLKQIGNVVRLEIDRVQQAEGGGKLPLDGKLERGRTQFFVSLYNLANVAPRETVTLKVAATDVPDAYQKLKEAANSKGRVVNAQINEQDRQNVNAQLEFDVLARDVATIQAALQKSGEVLSRQVARAPESDNVTDKKVLYRVQIVDATTIDPRQTVTLAVEVSDVEAVLKALKQRVEEVKGRIIKSRLDLERSGRITGTAVYDVPLSAEDGLVDRIKTSGRVRVHRVEKNPQAHDGKLALARLEVTLSNVDLLVPQDEGLWAQVRRGLAQSLQGLAVSARLLIIGLLFVLPWLLLILALIWLIRRLWGTSPATAPPGSAPATTG